MSRLNTALAHVAAVIRRWLWRKPDPSDPYAYARVRNPRGPAPRSGAVAVEEPGDKRRR